jgi:hypothetical protein
LTDFQVGTASKSEPGGQDAIIRALEGAAGGLSFTELQRKCPSLRRPNFAYHLKKLTEDNGLVEKDTVTGLYRLPLGPVRRADILYWIIRINDGKDDPERCLAAEQLRSICESKRVSLVEFRETLLPFVLKILSNELPSTNQLKATVLTAVVNQLNLTGNDAAVRAVKLSLFKSLEDLLKKTTDLNLRAPVREAFLKLVESEDELMILVDMAETLVPRADEEISVFQRLMQAPPSIRSEMRDRLFDLSVRTNDAASTSDKTSQRARELLYYFRTSEPLKREEIPAMLSNHNVF